MNKLIGGKGEKYTNKFVYIFIMNVSPMLTTSFRIENNNIIYCNLLMFHLRCFLIKKNMRVPDMRSE